MSERPRRVRKTEPATTEMTISEVRYDRQVPAKSTRLIGRRWCRYPLGDLKPGGHFEVRGTAGQLRNAVQAVSSFKRRQPTWKFITERFDGGVRIYRAAPQTDGNGKEAHDRAVYASLPKETAVPVTPVS